METVKNSEGLLLSECIGRKKEKIFSLLNATTAKPTSVDTYNILFRSLARCSDDLTIAVFFMEGELQTYACTAVS
jgi:hypothetical protein